MRKPLALLGVMVFTSANGQDYFLSNPVWRQFAQCMDGSGCLRTDEFIYFLNGDTMVGGKTYKNIIKKVYWYDFFYGGPPAGSCDKDGEYSVHAGSIRSDSMRMYLLSDTSEVLLYNFNLSVGDTLPETVNNFPGSVIIVTGIDSVEVPGGYWKRFALDDGWYLTEGIGHDKGLLEPIPVMLECGYSLSCYVQNDTTYYPAKGEDCQLNVGIKYLNPSHHNTIYPNPFTTNATVEANYPIIAFRLYSISGKLVTERNGLHSRSIELWRSGLPNGMYFVEIVSGDGFLNRQKVVIR